MTLLQQYTETSNQEVLYNSISKHIATAIKVMMSYGILPISFDSDEVKSTVFLRMVNKVEKIKELCEKGIKEQNIVAYFSTFVSKDEFTGQAVKIPKRTKFEHKEVDVESCGSLPHIAPDIDVCRLIQEDFKGHKFFEDRNPKLKYWHRKRLEEKIKNNLKLSSRYSRLLAERNRW